MHDFPAVVEPFITAIHDPRLRDILTKMATQEVELQICCASILIDINKTAMTEAKYVEYLDAHHITTYEDFMKRFIEEPFTADELCCECFHEKKYGYTRFMTFSKFEREFQKSPPRRSKYDLSHRKIADYGWSGNYRTKKSEYVWITPTNEYEVRLEFHKTNSAGAASDPYFEANFTWDYCGLRRYPENLFSPIDGMTEEVLRIDYPAPADFDAKVYQPNSTIGDFKPRSFYISAASIPNNYFGLTFCPYNPSLQGKERVHKNYRSSAGFSVRSLGLVWHNVMLDKNDRAAVIDQMKKILNEAINRLV